MSYNCFIFTGYRKFILFFIISSVFLNYPNSIAQDANVRISWDFNSYRELTSVKIANKKYIETDLYYPRIKKLRDGSLLMVFMNHQVGFDIFTRKSYDNGVTWSDAIMVRQRFTASSTADKNDKMVFATPDFIELQNGQILLAYQWRYQKGYTDIENTNQNCGIEIMTSFDSGETFTDPRVVYLGRNWEPYLLQIPSGEIQMYITDSNEVADNISQPCVSLLRSFDNGLTWQNKKLATFRDGELLSRTFDERSSYDGMPSAKYLSSDNGIAMALEVWSSRYQVDVTPVIVYSSLEKNWKYDDLSRARGGPGLDRKKQLHKDFRGFAPYMEILPDGEIIVQSNGVYKGQQGMWVFIGDTKADNFSYASSPYDGYWGLIEYLGNNEVISAGTFNYNKDGKNHSGIKAIKGRLNYAKNIKKGELEILSLSSVKKNSRDLWFIGQASVSSAYLDFGYSDISFDFTACLFDKNLISFTPNNSDAVEFLLNRKDLATGKSKTYQLAINTKGVFSVNKEHGNSWLPQDISELEVVSFIIDGTVNDESDEDVGFAAKVEVPWQLIGGNPSEDEVFRIHMRHRYKDLLKEAPVAQLESMAGEDGDCPETWLRIIFN